MFREDWKTIEDVQNFIREQWKWYKECTEMEDPMTPEQAVEQVYGVGQGIVSALSYEAYDKAFSQEFRAEWEDWRHNMLFGEE